MGVFNKTIIPLALVGYKMIMANKAPKSQLAAMHLVGNLPSHIQRTLVKNSELPS